MKVFESRLNLDPFGKYNEETIWDVLKKTKLYNKVKSMPDELSTHVGDGESLSVGEKQLVCLARTLLQKSKVMHSFPSFLVVIIHVMFLM